MRAGDSTVHTPPLPLVFNDPFTPDSPWLLTDEADVGPQTFHGQAGRAVATCVCVCVCVVQWMCLSLCG